MTVSVASCGRCGLLFSAPGGFCERCGCARVGAAVPSMLRGQGAPALVGTTAAPTATRVLAVGADVAVLGVVLVIAVVASVVASAAWLLVGLVVLLGVVAAQTGLLATSGRSLGRYLAGVRTVDDLTGLPPGVGPAVAAAFGRRTGTATIALRAGRDPLTPIVSGPAPSVQSDSTGRWEVSAGAPATLGQRAGSGVAIVLDSGQRVLVESSLVLGRNPASNDADAVFSWPDLSRSLSKNHVLLEWTGATLRVQDLGSTNGTTVLEASGARHPALPGSWVDAPTGSSLLFGSRSATVGEVLQ